MTRGWTLFAVALAFLPWGCVSFPEQPPSPERYVLKPISSKERSLSPAGTGIWVAGVHLPAGLASNRIAVIRRGRHLDHFADARWAAPLPDLLRDYFLDCVENRWGAIAWGRAPARYRLVVAVRDFQAEYPSGLEQPPVLRVHLVAVLLAVHSGKVLARANERRSQKLGENRIGAVVEGLNGLLGKAFTHVLDRFSARLEEEKQLPLRGSPSSSLDIPPQVS